MNISKMTTEQLRLNLIRWSDSYYNCGTSLVSDSVFDAGRDRLENLSPGDPVLKTIGAPIPENSPWKKAKHKIPMGSLGKCNTNKEFLLWVKKNEIKNSTICSEKLDGISIDIEYEAGHFIKAITRGDGIMGEDISSNVIKMQNVPENLPNKWAGSIRGEIVLMESDFLFINSILECRGESTIKNARNGASGISKRLDGTLCEYLTVLFYDCTGNFNFENEKLKFMDNELQLETVWWKLCKNPDDVIKIYEEYDTSKRTTLNHDIDGLVIRANNKNVQDRLGYKDNRPKFSIAWKFPSMKVKTTIIDIKWQLGLTGKLTPVAIFKPVKIGGVTVKRASLHNWEIFNSFNLCKNDTVLIERSNDVIPKVLKNMDKEKEYETRGKKFKVPETCPQCFGLIKINFDSDGVTQARCINEDCKGKEYGNLKKWADVNFKDSKGFGYATIIKFHEIGLINKISDFYKLKENDIVGLPGFGKRKAEIILKVINEHREVTLDNFIGGLNIPNFGRRMTQYLINAGIDTLEKMQKATLTDLIAIDCIEHKTASVFKTNLTRLEPQINDLLNVGVVITKQTSPDEVLKPTEGVLAGKSFCFTGAIQHEENGKRLTRKDMQSLVVKNGGIVFNTAKNGLDYLVQADPNSKSSKTKNAEKIGTKVISETEFFKFIK